MRKFALTVIPCIALASKQLAIDDIMDQLFQNSDRPETTSTTTNTVTVQTDSGYGNYGPGPDPYAELQQTCGK